MIVTEKCDAYSFGVLALEILMGTHLGELLTSLSSSSPQNMMLNEILDQRLPPPNRLVARDVFFLLLQLHLHAYMLNQSFDQQ